MSERPKFDPGKHCALSFAHGSLVGQGASAQDGPHEITIKNDVQHPVLIKVSDAAENTFSRVFIAPGRSLTMNGIPNGAYTVRYVVDPILSHDCETVAWARKASKFPGPKSLAVTSNAMGDQFSSVLEYTLYTVPGGNVRPSGISLSEFNQD